MSEAKPIDNRLNLPHPEEPAQRASRSSGRLEGCLTHSERVVGAWLYILRCADGSFYTGTTRSDLEKRIGEHQSGLLGGYTAKRRPITLAYAQHFDLITDAIAAERQIKGWSRVKKEALIAGDFAGLRAAAKRKGSFSKHLVGGAG